MQRYLFEFPIITCSPLSLPFSLLLLHGHRLSDVRVAQLSPLYKYQWYALELKKIYCASRGVSQRPPLKHMIIGGKVSAGCLFPGSVQLQSLSCVHSDLTARILTKEAPLKEMMKYPHKKKFITKWTRANDVLVHSNLMFVAYSFFGFLHQSLKVQ